MKILLFILAGFAVSFSSCASESDYCRAFCQKAGECADCGGLVDMDGCIDECLSLDDETKKKLVDCYKGDDCYNYFMCSQIIEQTPPSPCLE
ncbi:MAG: hypothetical protein JXR95_05700 [Deltaproteobacteria bacterium]|nr:hypothetical protein [Deltaproteobacteria bacterium]